MPKILGITVSRMFATHLLCMALLVTLSRECRADDSGTRLPCNSSKDCSSSHFCNEATHICTPREARPLRCDDDKNCPPVHYCDTVTRRCKPKAWPLICHSDKDCPSDQFCRTAVCVPPSDEDLANFIFSRIPELQGQATSGGRRQFAALIFLDEGEVENLQQFQFHPHHIDGTPYVDNTLPFSPAEPWNYVVARPNRQTEQHAEEILLEQLPIMWNNFINRGTHEPPAMIVLFTRLYPCTTDTPGATHRCAEQIRNALEMAPYAAVPSRVLAYNADDDTPARDQMAQSIAFMMANIIIQALPMGSCFYNPRTSEGDVMTPSTCIEPSSIQSLQGCLLQCLEDDIYQCVGDPAVGGHKAYLVNVLVDNCLLNEDRKVCFRDTFLEKTGAACASLQKQAVVERLGRCHETCSLMKPISKPRQDARDFDYQIALLRSAGERKHYQQPTTFGCKDRRRTGLLCSFIDDTYLTAGNSLCRDDHPCGYHDEAYTWCYTSINNNWDYCCSGTCGYHSNDYLWCNAGNTWQYCGKGGTVPTGTRTSKASHPCLADHPCGLHYDVKTNNDYFWCYVDTFQTWDYCCSPEPEDNECAYNGGTSYKWCKTSYYQKVTSQWQYCYY